MTSKSILPSHAALTVLLVLWKSEVSACQVLRAEYAKIPLPSPDFGMSPVFDGDHSIYLLGGVGAWRRILRFNISTETIEQVGELLYGNDLGQNGAAINTNGKIFSIGGGLIDGIGRVQSFDPPQDIVSRNLSNLPYDISAGSRIPLEGGDQVLIIGGSLAGFNLDKILLYDMIKESATVLNNKTLPISMVNCKAARLGNKAFVFGYPESTRNPPAYILDVDTLEIQLSPEDFDFPRFVDEPQVISNGYNYFLLGGWSNESDHQSDVPTDGIVRFDPEDFSWNFIKVENFPIQSYEHFWRPPSSIYIEKLNRIYSFGGMSRNFSSPNSGMVRDDIWYIDLSPLMPTEAPSTTTQRPDTFSCFNRPDGLYPHPEDCDKFIGCHGGVSEEYDCPEPLLFDPIEGRCDYPENVLCDLTCFGKPDGQYPHPNDCSLFLICKDESLEVFRCPSPLLFNPETKRCEFPELVQCAVN